MYFSESWLIEDNGGWEKEAAGVQRSLLSAAADQTMMAGLILLSKLQAAITIMESC
jgi:hypothetical protein